MTSSVKSRPKFRIVEDTSEFRDIYEYVKQDYLDPKVRVSDILKKYNISNKNYQRIRKEIIEETGVTRKPMDYDFDEHWRHETRFISQVKTTKKFKVVKVMNGKYHHFGVYDDLKTALEVRDILEEANWDKEVYKKLRMEMFGKEIKEKTEIEKIYDEFKKDFLEGFTTKELIRKYGITKTHYNALSKAIRTEMGLHRKPRRKK